MSMASLTLMPLIIGIGLLYWSSLLDDEHPFWKLMLQLMFLPLCFMTINLGVVDATIVYSGNAELVERLALFTEVLGYLMFAVGAYIFFMILKEIYDMLIQRKKSKESELYD